MSSAPVVGTSVEVLAARAAAGDRAAFEELVRATSPMIFALALRLVGDEQDARDVLQETYLRAFRSIDRFRGEASISTWLYRICANCASTHLRRHRRGARLTGFAHDEVGLPDLGAERDLAAVESTKDDRDRLVAALAELPRSLRAVVVLHDIYDLPHDAIAEELGISRAASKVRLHRARRRLRELLFRADEPSNEPEAGSEAEVIGIDEGRGRRGAKTGRQVG